jgi:hypothetical protein
MPHSGRQNADQMLLTALAFGATVEAAAQKAGVSVSTVHRRLKDPKFRRRLQTMRDDSAQRTSSLLTGLGGEAAKNLVELMRPPTAANVRLGASRTILEIGMKQREFGELTERIAALERLLENDET